MMVPAKPTESIRRVFYNLYPWAPVEVGNELWRDYALALGALVQRMAMGSG